MVHTVEFGAPGSLRYRMIFRDDEGGHLSPWHELPLDDPTGYLTFVCKTPRGSWAKLEVAELENLNPLRLMQFRGSPTHFTENVAWNLGMLPQTWADPEEENAEYGGLPYDGRPLEVFEIGSRTSRTGEVYTIKPITALGFVEDGVWLTWKIVAIAADDPLAEAMSDSKDLMDVMPDCIPSIWKWLCQNCGSKVSSTPGQLSEDAAFVGGWEGLDLHGLGRVIAQHHASWSVFVSDRPANGPRVPSIAGHLLDGCHYERLWARYTHRFPDVGIPLHAPSPPGAMAVLERRAARGEEQEVNVGKEGGVREVGGMAKDRVHSPTSVLSGAGTPAAAEGANSGEMDAQGEDGSPVTSPRDRDRDDNTTEASTDHSDVSSKKRPRERRSSRGGFGGGVSHIQSNNAVSRMEMLLMEKDISDDVTANSECSDITLALGFPDIVTSPNSSPPSAFSHPTSAASSTTASEELSAERAALEGGESSRSWQRLGLKIDIPSDGGTSPTTGTDTDSQFSPAVSSILVSPGEPSPLSTRPGTGNSVSSNSSLVQKRSPISGKSFEAMMAAWDSSSSAGDGAGAGASPPDSPNTSNVDSSSSSHMFFMGGRGAGGRICSPVGGACRRLSSSGSTRRHIHEAAIHASETAGYSAESSGGDDDHAALLCLGFFKADGSRRNSGSRRSSLHSGSSPLKRTMSPEWPPSRFSLRMSETDSGPLSSSAEPWRSARTTWQHEEGEAPMFWEVVPVNGSKANSINLMLGAGDEEGLPRGAMWHEVGLSCELNELGQPDGALGSGAGHKQPLVPAHLFPMVPRGTRAISPSAGSSEGPSFPLSSPSGAAATPSSSSSSSASSSSHLQAYEKGSGGVPAGLLGEMVWQGLGEEEARAMSGERSSKGGNSFGSDQGRGREWEERGAELLVTERLSSLDKNLSVGDLLLPGKEEVKGAVRERESVGWREGLPEGMVNSRKRMSEEVVEEDVGVGVREVEMFVESEGGRGESGMKMMPMAASRFPMSTSMSSASDTDENVPMAFAVDSETSDAGEATSGGSRFEFDDGGLMMDERGRGVGREEENSLHAGGAGAMIDPLVHNRRVSFSQVVHVRTIPRAHSSQTDSEKAPSPGTVVSPKKGVGGGGGGVGGSGNPGVVRVIPPEAVVGPNTRQSRSPRVASGNPQKEQQFSGELKWKDALREQGIMEEEGGQRGGGGQAGRVAAAGVESSPKAMRIPSPSPGRGGGWVGEGGHSGAAAGGKKLEMRILSPSSPAGSRGGVGSPVGSGPVQRFYTNRGVAVGAGPVSGGRSPRSGFRDPSWTGNSPRLLSPLGGVRRGMASRGGVGGGADVAPPFVDEMGPDGILDEGTVGRTQSLPVTDDMALKRASSPVKRKVFTLPAIPTNSAEHAALLATMRGSRMAVGRGRGGEMLVIRRQEKPRLT